MSRIGKKYITVPPKVTVKLNKQKISVDGPKGNLSRILPSVICCTLDEKENQLLLVKSQETRLAQALYGLSRTGRCFASFLVNRLRDSPPYRSLGLTTG